MQNNSIKAKVVMLPTNDKTLLKKFYVGHNYQLLFKQNHIIAPYQHLYFTTDEPILDGDWVLHDGRLLTNVVEVRKVANTLYGKDNDGYILSHCKKVTASTDPALGLPAIPIAWIRDVYVPSSGSIKEVRLELIEKWAQRHSIGKWDDCEPTIKLTPNNEVVIVDEAMDIFEKVVDGYVSHEEGLKQLKQMETEQELEDAANNWIDLHYNKGVEYSKSKRGAANPKSGFIAGAKWQKEQSGNQIITLTPLEWYNTYREDLSLPEAAQSLMLDYAKYYHTEQSKIN